EAVSSTYETHIGKIRGSRNHGRGYGVRAGSAGNGEARRQNACPNGASARPDRRSETAGQVDLPAGTAECAATEAAVAVQSRGSVHGRESERRGADPQPVGAARQLARTAARHPDGSDGEVLHDLDAGAEGEGGRASTEGPKPHAAADRKAQS